MSVSLVRWKKIYVCKKKLYLIWIVKQWRRIFSIVSLWLLFLNLMTETYSLLLFEPALFVFTILILLGLIRWYKMNIMYANVLFQCLALTCSQYFPVRISLIRECIYAFKNIAIQTLCFMTYRHILRKILKIS